MAENSRLFLKLTKKASGALIQGEAQVTEFANQIELEDWNWNLSRDKSDGSIGSSSSSGAASDRQLGSVTPSPLLFSKYMDRSTSSILQAMVNDDLLMAEIVLEEAADVDFNLVVKLKNVRVLEYEVDGDVEDKLGQVKERWTFNYEEIQFHYALPGGRGKTSAFLARDPASSTDKPESDDLEQFKKFALRLSSKSVATNELEKMPDKEWEKKAKATKQEPGKKAKGED